MAGSAAADMTSSLLPRLSPPPFCEMASALTKLVPKLVTKSVTVSTLLYRKLPVNPAPNTLPGPAPGFPQMETCAHAADARVAKPRERVRAWTGPGASPGVHLRCKSVPWTQARPRRTVKTWSNLFVDNNNHDCGKRFWPFLGKSCVPAPMVLKMRFAMPIRRSERAPEPTSVWTDTRRATRPLSVDACGGIRYQNTCRTLCKKNTSKKVKVRVGLAGWATDE